MEHQPPPFFVRGPAPLAKLAFFTVASVFLMILDVRFRYAEPLRDVISIVVYPLQQAAIAPVAAYSRIGEFFSTQAELRRENAELRAEQLKNSQTLLAADALARENEQLRALLGAKERVPADAIFAEIVYAGRDPFSRKVIIDKGSQQGIEPGRPVIDAAGVIGQVTRVQPLIAEVTLLTDKDHPIPVQITRNGLRGVVYGSGDGSTLELRYMATNAEVENGDILVTSGLDGIYPAGLPVAKVVRVERDAAFAFARIVGTPLAGIDRYRQVLVLARAETPATAGMEPEPAGERKPARTKRSRRAE